MCFPACVPACSSGGLAAFAPKLPSSPARAPQPPTYPPPSPWPTQTSPGTTASTSSRRPSCSAVPLTCCTTASNGRWAWALPPTPGVGPAPFCLLFDFFSRGEWRGWHANSPSSPGLICSPAPPMITPAPPLKRPRPRRPHVPLAAALLQHDLRGWPVGRQGRLALQLQVCVCACMCVWVGWGGGGGELVFIWGVVLCPGFMHAVAPPIRSGPLPPLFPGGSLL